MENENQICYVAIRKYKSGNAYLHNPPQTVLAGDRVSAMIQFDLRDVKYDDVMPYVEEESLF